MAIATEINFIGYQDVYNMEVPGPHNFSVCGGLVVHNCYDALGYGILAYHVGQTAPTKEDAPPIRRHKDALSKRRKKRRH